MREVEKGSVVTLQAHVVKVDKYTCLLALGAPGGQIAPVATKYLQLVEPPPFKVGDRVDVTTNGTNRIIDRISTRYHLENSPDNVTHTREELKHSQPTPIRRERKAMREVIEGDRVTFTGVVKTVGGRGDGENLVETEAGDMAWLPKKDLQLIDPPLFEVGDRVVTDGGSNVIIGEIGRHLSYRVKFPDGSWCWRDADQLKPAPPKPEYRVVRKDDRLGVQRIDDNPDGNWSFGVLMSATEAVIEPAIVGWARDFGIDADAARKLVAEPRIIGRHSLDNSTHTVAIRRGSGWCVILTGRNSDNAVDTLRYGTPQPESIGRGIFRKIEGPYEVNP